MHYKIISFYSEPDESSKYYTDNALRLKEECKKYGLDYYIIELEGLGNYYKNCRMKPSFIYECMMKFKMPLIWLDADTKITKKPRFTKTNFGCIKKNDNRFPFFAHCLQFDYTQESLEILSEWNDRCKKCNDQKVGDHSLLVRLLKERKTEVSHIDNFTIYGITPKRKIKSK